jgi:hypothetical protein
MGKINYGRAVIGIILTTIFYFLTDGVVHKILGNYHMAAITGAGKVVQGSPTDYIYFAVYDLCKALVAVLIYVGIRPRFGPGVKTAVWAGAVAWLGCIVAPSIAAMPFPFYERVYFYKLIGMELVTMVVGAIIGAAIYKE